MERIKSSAQNRNKQFENSAPWNGLSFSKNIGVMLDFLSGGDQRIPKLRLPVKQVDPRYFMDPEKNQLNSTWLGHSSLMINIDGFKILTDPVFEKKISVFGPSRFNGNVPVDTSLLPMIDVVIISHNHYDHLNKMSIQHLKLITRLFVVPLAMGAQLEKWGVEREKIVEMDWWEEFRVGKNLKIVATPALHYSGRGVIDRNTTLWASWVIIGPEHKVFFSGDSGYFHGFKQMGNKYGPFNMTFLECGAYDENWPHIHMFPEETVQAHLDLKGDILQPIHWATFNLALHPWYEPVQRMNAAAGKENIQTVTPMVGDTVIYDYTVPNGSWWKELIPKDRRIL